MTESSQQGEPPTPEHELEIIERLQNFGEEYGLIIEPDEVPDQYAHRIVNELAHMISELTDVQRNVLALIA